jgi:hypothetical protein
MSKFWGNRIKNGILNPADPVSVAKMNAYKTTDVVIVDLKGNTLLPRQPIYNPKSK